MMRRRKFLKKATGLTGSSVLASMIPWYADVAKPIIHEQAGSTQNISYSLKPGHYLNIVKEHVETVLRHASDQFGEFKTPLIADILEVNTKEPYIQRVSDIWHANTGHPGKQITFNFAIYQQFSCLLRELS